MILSSLIKSKSIEIESGCSLMMSSRPLDKKNKMHMFFFSSKVRREVFSMMYFFWAAEDIDTQARIIHHGKHLLKYHYVPLYGHYTDSEIGIFRKNIPLFITIMDIKHRSNLVFVGIREFVAGI